MKNTSELAYEFISNMSLKSIPIIDMHTHMGGVYGVHLPKKNTKEMIEVMEHNNVELIISAPHEDLFNPLSENNEIEEAMKKYPQKIKGYFSFNPNYCDDFDKVVQKIEGNQGYIGFKFLPDYHRVHLDSEEYEKALEYANNKKLLVLVHTWGISAKGESCNSIDKVENILKKYKDCVILMGHSAQGQADEAIEIAKRYDNAYLDVTDTGRLNGLVEKMVEKAGSQKIVFGTDFPWYDSNYTLGYILFSRISDKHKENILHKNARRLLDC